MVVDMFLDRAQDTVNMIKDLGEEAFAFEANIVNEDDCKKIAQACVNKYGKIDILVNNAGIIPNTDTGIETTPVEVWDHVMNVNLRGPLLCCRYVLPVMVSQGSGSIVNISSSSAFMCGPTPGKKGNIAYPVSKYALNFSERNNRYSVRSRRNQSKYSSPRYYGYTNWH
jgi:NAD(P)-dependent dehydrogenase (short-subunit alcohol dehydrogenase family)